MLHQATPIDIAAMRAVLRTESTRHYAATADNALALAAELRGSPDAMHIEDAATTIEFLVGVLDAHLGGHP